MEETGMKLSERIKGTAILCGMGFLIVAISVFLTDLLFLKNISFNWFQIALMGFFSSLCMTPLFYWVRIVMENGGIEATQLSGLELNERDVREAISNWVYIHYKKKVEGDLEFARDESGALSCKVSVRNDS